MVLKTVLNGLLYVEELQPIVHVNLSIHFRNQLNPFWGCWSLSYCREEAGIVDSLPVHHWDVILVELKVKVSCLLSQLSHLLLQV